MRFMQFRARDAYALHLSKMEKVHLSPHDHIDGPERIIESLSPVTISLLLSLVFGLVYMSSPIHLSRPDPDQPRVAAYYGSCQLVPTCTSVTLPLGDNSKAHVSQQHLMSIQRAWHIHYCYLTCILMSLYCISFSIYYLYLKHSSNGPHQCVCCQHSIFSKISIFRSISNHNTSYLDHISLVELNVFWHFLRWLWRPVRGGFRWWFSCHLPSPLGHRCRLYGV